MNKLVASFVILLATSVPAWASASVSCASDDGISVHFQAFLGPELVVTEVEIITLEGHWSTFNVDAEQISLLQSFSDSESIRIDVSDPNAEHLIAKIRLFVADEGIDVALAGIVHMPGNGVYALICEGP